jgi:DNA-binding NarL/FixJ family response regulator
MQGMRVVIADDHTLYREGLARLLRESQIDVVGEAPDGESALRVVEQTAPDVVLLNLNMPRVSGLQAMRRLAEEAVPSRVLVLSVSDDESDVTEAIFAGASGYVLKDEPVEEVIAGIRAAAGGGARISPRIAGALLSHVLDAIEAGEDLAGGGLSTTELHLLGLIAAGKRDRDVSERLSIGEASVGEYMRSIFVKLQVESRVREARRSTD